MAGAAKRLEIVERQRIAATLQRDNVIDFQPTGTTALPAAPAVALQDGPAHPSPVARVKVQMVPAHLAQFSA